MMKDDSIDTVPEWVRFLNKAFEEYEKKEAMKDRRKNRLGKIQ